jgi:hypothetical protein
VAVTGTRQRGRIAATSVALTVSGALLSGCIAGPTYGTGKGSHEQLLEDVTGVLAIGPKDDKPEIEYKPRAELVRPGETTAATLPPPQEGLRTAGGPAWPESPEERRRRVRAEATLNRDDPDFRPEVAPPVVPVRADDGSVASTFGPRSRQNSEMGNPTAQRDEFRRRIAVSQQGSPTSRRYLSEPPLDYRQASATAPTDDLGEDEWRKERRLKREARKPGERSWRDLVPWL